MKQQTLKVKKEIKFLSQLYSELPSNCLFNKGITGCGGTTVEINSQRNSIICVPNISLVLNKQSDDLFGIYGETPSSEIRRYLRSNRKYKKFIVVYDSLPKLIDIIGESIYSKYFLLIDEYHILFNSYSFRDKAVRNILKVFKSFDSYCFMTATPLDDATILTELKDLPITTLDWVASKTVDINIENTFYVLNTLKGHIKFCLSSDYNVHIFMNSMKSISKVIRDMDLDEEQYKVVCSEDSISKYKMLNCTKSVIDLKRVNFYTSTCFEGVDIYDPKGKTIIVSDSNISTTMMDISTLFVQICGRLRDSIYKDQVTFIVNANSHRYCKYPDEKSFLEDVREFDRMGKYTESLYNKGNATYKRKEQLTYSPESYTKIYVIKDEENNLCYDENLKKVDIKNFDIVNNIYHSYYTILDNVESQPVLKVSSFKKPKSKQESISNAIAEVFDYNKEYDYVEMFNLLKGVLKEYGIKLTRSNIKQYIDFQIFRTKKNGKSYSYYKLIK